MRNSWSELDTGDRRAIARGAAAGLGLMTILALRADWFLASGVLTFHRTGENVAAYIMGLDLLPWALVFTAILASATVIALGWTGSVVPRGRNGTVHSGRPSLIRG